MTRKRKKANKKPDLSFIKDPALREALEARTNTFALELLKNQSNNVEK